MSKGIREYYLMHKDIAVCLMEISEDGEISKIRRLNENAAHFPIGGMMNDSRLHQWWRDRAVPKTRHGAKTALQRLGYDTTANALVNNLALSLTDCYWVKPRESDIKWAEVSLFSNDFVDALGELNMNENAMIDTRFSVASSQGELQKKWCISENGFRHMVKGNYGVSYQQSLNEVFATSIHETLGCKNYLPYELFEVDTTQGGKGIGCRSYCIANENVELISAWEIIQIDKYKENESLYHSLKNALIKLGMKEEEFSAFMDYLIMTDYLITNTDRHMNNIGVLRDPDTLKILGFAPIYDSGNSMFFNLSYDELKVVDLDSIKTRGFLSINEKNNLKYVKDRNCIDLTKINADFSIYEKDIKEQQMRYPLIKELFNKKLNTLKRFQKGLDIWKR